LQIKGDTYIYIYIHIYIYIYIYIYISIYIYIYIYIDIDIYNKIFSKSESFDDLQSQEIFPNTSRRTHPT
jgi:hypothetical protein